MISRKHVGSWLALTRATLCRLAQPGAEQIDYIHKLGGSPDELGLEFDDVTTVLLPWLRESGHNAAVSSLECLEEALSSEELSWGERDILRDQAWERIRTLARLAGDEVDKLRGKT